MHLRDMNISVLNIKGKINKIVIMTHIAKNKDRVVALCFKKSIIECLMLLSDLSWS
jgi:hypothetical protein